LSALRVRPGARTETALCRLAQDVAGLSGWRRYGLAFGLGALLAGALPPFDLTPLIFIAFPGLLWLDEGSAGPWASARLGYVFGVGFFVAGLYWIAAALFVDIARFWWALPFAVVGLPALLKNFMLERLGIPNSPELDLMLRVVSEAGERLIVFAYEQPTREERDRVLGGARTEGNRVEREGVDPMTFKLELGTKVRDRVTRLEGIVVGRHEYLYGCRRYTVQPVELKDGKPVEQTGFDEDALEVLIEAPPHEVKDAGGPQREPSARASGAGRSDHRRGLRSWWRGVPRNRPGRRSAGSMLLGRLVAAMTMTSPRLFSPSISASSCATTRFSTSPSTRSLRARSRGSRKRVSQPSRSGSRPILHSVATPSSSATSSRSSPLIPCGSGFVAS
jgi:hypothetical protein